MARASTGVPAGAESPPGAALWKGAQTPIQEHTMVTIHLHQTTTATEARNSQPGQAQS